MKVFTLFLPLISASSTFTVNTTIEVGYNSDEIGENDLEGFFDGIYRELGIISCNNFIGELQFFDF